MLLRTARSFLQKNYLELVWNYFLQCGGARATNVIYNNYIFLRIDVHCCALLCTTPHCCTIPGTAHCCCTLSCTLIHPAVYTLLAKAKPYTTATSSFVRFGLVRCRSVRFGLGLFFFPVQKRSVLNEASVKTRFTYIYLVKCSSQV